MKTTGYGKEKAHFRAVGVWGAVLLTAPCAMAQAWPAKAVRIIVASTPGSAPDVTARTVAEKLGLAWGQQPIVENKPGAGCGIAMDAARSAPADGYTIILAHAACIAVTPLTFKTTKYDIDRDFSTLAIIGVSPMMIVASASSQANNLSELVAQARSNPEKVSIGNPGRTTIPHLGAELIAQQTGTRMFQVPFGSPGQMVSAAVAGDVMYAIDSMAVMQGMVKAGKLRVLAVTADKVLPGLEPYPLAKSSIPGLEVFGWFAILSPKNVPRDLATRMNDDINKAILQPDVIARFATLGIYPRPGTLTDASEFVKREQLVWGKVIRDANIQAE